MYTKINEKDSAMKLGAIYSKEKTTFTLFSPVADSVFVIFYDKGNDSAETGRRLLLCALLCSGWWMWLLMKERKNNDV